MSQVLTVPTHFNDIGELSEGFLDRVEQDTLILYGPVAYEDGSEIEFVVLLADGTPAIEGTGRVRAAVDGGADRVPETRYDVVVEALELDGRYEVVFERLVLARQAVSEHPEPDPQENEPTGELELEPDPVEDEDTNQMRAAPEAGDDESDDPVVEEATEDVDDFEPGDEEVFSLAPDEVLSVSPDELVSDAPEESAAETEPPDELDDEPETVIAEVQFDAQDLEDEGEDELGDEPATVIAAVDPAAMMAEEVETGPEEQPSVELDADEQAALEANADASDEPAPAEEAYAEALALDPDYAFEHGIAVDPKVGMPVPIPSMAAPPEAPPAPPRLRLADPPDGLTRPSFAQAEEPAFGTDEEVSDVHTTGLFAYEEGLPIPSRPPFPDPNGPRSATSSEASADYDVEESEPPEVDDDEYEDVRLSDFAGAVEEG
ncbi:MAG: hypothetical protein ACN4G0_16240 [Polyangiales bacterium]